MLMTNNKYSTVKGSILAYGLVIMTMVSIVLTSILGYIAQQTKYSLRVHAKEEALSVAEAGIHFYRWYLAHNVDGKTAQQLEAFWNSGDAYGVGEDYEGEYVKGSVSGHYRLSVTPPQSGSSIVTVQSTGWVDKYPDDTRTIEVRFRRPSWSEFMVLSDSVVRFGSGTEIFGRIHSNFGLRFDGLAHNLVTSAVSSYDDPDHNDHVPEFGVHTHVNPVDPVPPAAIPDRPDIFEGGRQVGVASSDFNGILADLNHMEDVAKSGESGSVFFDDSSQGRHIILKTNDTFDVRGIKNFVEASNTINKYEGDWQTLPLPDNGVIFVDGHVVLEGTIDTRRVTIVAANLESSNLKNVYISKDVRYTNDDCSDMLGIIAQDDLDIPRDSENFLRIDGALLAYNGRVGRKHYNGWGSVRDTIEINGAIVSKQRYGFAYVDDTGYQNRDFYYDNDLLYCPPPYFPLGTEYEMDLWEEK